MTARKHLARILRKAAAKLDPRDFPYPHEMVNGVFEGLARWDRERSRPNMVTHGPDGVIGAARKTEAIEQIKADPRAYFAAQPRPDRLSDFDRIR